MKPEQEWYALALITAATLAFAMAGLFLVTASYPAAMAAGAEPALQVTLENFESYSSGSFPEKWRARNNDARKIYKVDAESGNRFLRARAEKQAIQIGLEHSFEPKLQRQLAWRWRAREFPTGADERLADKHDTVAQVYVIFDNQVLPRIIKYMWSGVVPLGSRFTHPLYSRGRVVILRSGGADPSQWIEEKINFYEDYKKFYGSEPGKVQGIALMTSSDSTKSVAGADYDDFALLP